MARQARMIIPGVPHHVTQRGNRRERIFLEPDDEAIYLELMRRRLERHGVACWAYCLMPNHVHFILMPTDETGLARAIGEAHRRYAAFVGARGGWTGHLFQARFASFAMDDAHFLNALRYLAFNPVRAGLAASPQAWLGLASARVLPAVTARWPRSARRSRAPRFADRIELPLAERAALDGFDRTSPNGRPLGAPDFIAMVERRLGRTVRPGRRRRAARRSSASWRA